VKLWLKIFSGTVVVTICAPETPVTVSVYAPGVAAPLAVRVSMLLLLVGLGESDAVTLLGRPEIERLTLPLNPYCGST